MPSEQLYKKSFLYRFCLLFALRLKKKDPCESGAENRH
jgi:hypothetical protein